MPFGVQAQTSEQPAALSDEQRRDEYLLEIRRAIDAYDTFELKEALGHFERAHALVPSARTYRGIGVTAFGLGMYGRAIDELSHALQDERNPLTDELRRDTELRLAQARERHRPAPQTQTQTVLAADGGKEAGLSTQTWIAIASGAVGLLGVSVGSVFGIESISQGHSRDEHCTDQRCDARGVELADSAIRSGNISTVSFAVGLTGIAAGLTLWLTDSAPREHAGVRVRPGLASLQIEGAW